MVGAHTGAGPDRMAPPPGPDASEPPALGLRVPEGGLGSGLSELPHLAQSPRSNPQQAHSVVLNIIFIVTK